MDKKQFIECIKALKKQLRHDEYCCEVMQKIYPESFMLSYDNHFVIDTLLKLLKVATKDNHKDSWIDYYIYELDFGKDYSPNSVTLKDGTDFKLKTPTDLWKLLHV